MRALVLALCLLSACTSAYEVTRTSPYSRYTAYAVSPRFLFGLLHGARKGEAVTVHTMRGPIPGVVVAVDGDGVLIEASQPWLHGDSGAGVTNEDGKLIALLVGRVR